MIEISVSCKDLPKKDLLSHSDPVCVLFKEIDDNWIEVDRTEQLDNDPNPKWVSKFMIQEDEKDVKIKYVVYDWDKKKSSDLKKQDFLMEAIFTVEEIVSVPAMEKIVQNLGKKKKSEMIINAEKVNDVAKTVPFQLTFGAKKLKKMDKMSKSDPFFVIGRDTNVIVYRSEVIKNKSDVVWNQMQIDSSLLCNGDWNRNLIVMVLDKDRSKSELIGKAEMTLNDLFNAWRQGENNLEWELKDDNGKVNGQLYIQQWDFQL